MIVERLGVLESDGQSYSARPLFHDFALPMLATPEKVPPAPPHGGHCVESYVEARGSRRVEQRILKTCISPALQPTETRAVSTRARASYTAMC